MADTAHGDALHVEALGTRRGPVKFVGQLGVQSTRFVTVAVLDASSSLPATARTAVAVEQRSTMRALPNLAVAYARMVAPGSDFRHRAETDSSATYAFQRAAQSGLEPMFFARPLRRGPPRRAIVSVTIGSIGQNSDHKNKNTARTAWQT